MIIFDTRQSQLGQIASMRRLGELAKRAKVLQHAMVTLAFSQGGCLACNPSEIG